jgi:hypothetical protein
MPGGTTMKNIVKIALPLIIILTGGIMMFGFSGCGARKYAVDYGAQKDSFTGAKDRYREGEKVRLYFPYIATDTDYSFFLDGEELNPGYDESKGFIIEFTMPARDVTLSWKSQNSMEYIPDEEKRTTLSLDSFDGGGPEYTLEAEDPDMIAFERSIEYPNPDHDEMDGSPYNVIYTFEGLRPGKTRLFVTARSPIGDNYDAVYEAEIDDELNIKLGVPEINYLDGPLNEYVNEPE